MDTNAVNQDTSKINNPQMKQGDNSTNSQNPPKNSNNGDSPDMIKEEHKNKP